MDIKRIYKEIKGSNGRLMAIDIHYKEGLENMPIAIFAHGYKGFKDFGAWSIIGDQMANNGIVFVRFNFSHNGVSIENPMEFEDLKAFGENNYSKEVADLNTVIDYIYILSKSYSKWDENNISLIGHSRGGGMIILCAARNKKIRSIVTWAAISSTYNRMPIGEELQQWKDNGVRYVLNGRTKQEMPHYYQFYKDLLENNVSLNIEAAAKLISIPWLIIHGDNDEAVPLEEAQQLHQWSSNSRIEIISNGSHTFSISHPWENDELSTEMQRVVDLSIQFIKA